MARGAGITVENNFVKGLITEYTAMNFPEDAVTESDNCVFGELGTVKRRLGIDYEDDYSVSAISSLTTQTGAVSEFVWYPASSDGQNTFVVQQLGIKVIFFQNTSGMSLSANKKSFEVNLSDYKTSGSTDVEVANKLCRFTSGKGFLFIVNPYCDPIAIEYDGDLDDIIITRISLKIRDMQGEDDGYETDERSTTLSAKHKYNLYNQGWYHDTDTGNVITRWYNKNLYYPSNADVWWVYKNADENFDPDRADKLILGNTPSPKGHYIYNAFDIDRETETGITGLTRKTSGKNRPSTVCFYAGRVFYSGVSATKYSNILYYTQVIEDDTQFGKCYQSNDPTSESTFDLIDTDGGELILPNLDQIIEMKVLGEALIIIGTNGVMAVRGTDNGIFRATNFNLDKVSNTGTFSPLSVVEVENNIFFTNYDGIYVITKDQVGLSFEVANASKTTIQSFYDAIPTANKVYIKGAYNKREKIIRWVFSNTVGLTGYNYNKALDFNVLSKSFYPMTFDETIGPIISGIISMSGNTQVITNNNIVVGADQVVMNSLNNVVSEQYTSIPNTEIFKFSITGDISSGNPGFTFGELKDTLYRDFYSFDNTGTFYQSYFISGYRVRGEFLKPFNSATLAVVMKEEDGSGVLLQGIWDYGERMTTTQQVYVSKPSVTNIIKKVKLRGKGKSLQLKFASQNNAPFNIVGWSTFDTGGTIP